MGFIGDIFKAIIVDPIISIIEAVVQVVEVIVKLIMVLLGYDGGSTQIVEYFEVRNYPLFEDVDRRNPVKSSIMQSVLSNRDVGSNLIYHLVFRSLKANIQEFTNSIEQGDYFENFPDLDSYILIVDYDELTAALQTLTGVACTVETAHLRALSKSDWVKYWLQENKGYNVGTNALSEEYREITTSPATPTADTVTVTSSANHYDINITSEIATSDDALVDMHWYVNLNTIVYNAVPDTYTIQAYNLAGITITLPYTAPSKPTQLHYVSTYYRNSAPSRYYLFIYQVGSGTYTDLDTIEEPIQIDNSNLQAMPAIPLRLNNANYTTFGATKAQQIEDLVAILNLDAQEIIDTIMSDSGIAAGDLDHVYINFGVRMWDTTQAGMSYLFNMFENLYPVQGVTQGTYNNSPAGDDKPQNNIVVTTDDNKYAFQWSYITYQFTSLADINADTSSTENGIYYSDMSRFDSNNLLKYNYYVSSGKGTYNVGYKADNLDEVQDFLDGNGVTNPGTTSSEAVNWLQVTKRMSYNNPTPVLQEANGSTSTLIYLTPDAVYENNGSGVLRYIEAAAPETTIGQSITYYCCKPSGLDAYTVHGPIGALKVIDGDTGKFKTVKFNLGAKEDLMAPFIYSFVKNLSHNEVAKLFLAGAHASIYVAHYEVIEHAGMSFLTALVTIIIIIIVVYLTYSYGSGGGETEGFIAKLLAAAEVGTLYAIQTVLIPAIAKIAFKMIVQAVIQAIITELVDDPTLAMALNFLASAAIMAWDVKVGYSIGDTGPAGPDMFDDMGDMIGDVSVANSPSPGFTFDSVTSFSMINPLQMAQLATAALSGVNEVLMIDLKKDVAEFKEEKARWEEAAEEATDTISEIWEEKMGVGNGMPNLVALASTYGSIRQRTVPHTAEATLIAFEKQREILLDGPHQYDNFYKMKTEPVVFNV